MNRVMVLAWLMATLAPLAACNRDVKQRRFASPEEAAAALTQAAERFDRQALVEMLGSKGKPLIFSKDSVQDRQRALAFASEARIQHRIEMDSTRHRRHADGGPHRLAAAYPHREGQQLLALRRRSGSGRDPHSPHRPERARRHPGLPRVRRGSADVRQHAARRRRGEPVRPAHHQHAGQA